MHSDPFPKSQGNYTQPIHQWQQFGGSVGGAIVKDKLFCATSGTYDGSRKVNPIALHQQQHLQHQHQSAALPSTGDGHAVRQRECVPLWPARAPSRAATNQDVGFGHLEGNPSDAQPRVGFVRHDGLPRAECVSNCAHRYNTTKLDWQQRQLPFTTSASSWPILGFHHPAPTVVNNLRFQWGRDLETAGANGTAPYVSLSGLHCDLWRELRAAAHGGAGRAPHPDCRHTLDKSTGATPSRRASISTSSTK